MNPGGEYPGPLADRRDDRVPQLRVPLSDVLGLDDQVQLLRPERLVVDAHRNNASHPNTGNRLGGPLEIGGEVVRPSDDDELFGSPDDA